MPYVIVRARGSQPDISVEGPDRIIDKLSELGIDQIQYSSGKAKPAAGALDKIGRLIAPDPNSIPVSKVLDVIEENGYTLVTASNSGSEELYVFHRKDGN